MTDLPPPFPGPLTVERSALRTPDDVDRMLQLHALGWGVKRIARELGCAKNLGGHPKPATRGHLKTGHHDR